MDLYGEEIRRLWHPDEIYRAADVKSVGLLAYNQEKQITQHWLWSYGKGVYVNAHSMVVYIDRACRNNGRPSAKASYGIWFGSESKHNVCGLIDSSIPQTSTRAEIEALSKALETIREICAKDFALTEIKIATDSSFLVNAFSLWIETWIEDNGLGSDGQPIKHFERLKEIHDVLDEMEYGDDGGIGCEFWEIPRDDNGEADALANSALDGK
ncbi:MAG: hypothetical protein M1822_002569 [Bathelium mastoideum]|nr:MAG: hypothetical protein M1822_002569 [Bathelium mastoideum]